MEEGFGIGCFGADDETLHGVARAGEVAFSMSQIGDHLSQTKGVEEVVLAVEFDVRSLGLLRSPRLP